jgi:UDP-N-acetylmuramoyl-L-alanyl-D-glutamate--2,6-diaminopimelate ligase
MTSLEMPKTFPVACHTDNIRQGSTFVVIKGFSKDGLEFIPVALEKGATSVVIENGVMLPDSLIELCNAYHARIEYVDNTRKALAELSAQAADYPAKKLKIYGVTGTKGKTSSVWILYHMLCGLGKKAALISTVGNYIGTAIFNTGMTTPQPDYIHQFLKLCVESGVTHVVMETAAQATTFFRLETLQLEGLVFTNLEREHKELYNTLDEYFEAKKSICRFLKSDTSLFINYDTVYGKKLLQSYPHATTFSFENPEATWYCSWKDIENQKVLTMSCNILM